MAKFTKAQYDKWNALLSNDFRLDFQHLAVWGEKQAIRYIELEDGKTLAATIEWRDVVENYRRVGVRPDLHLAVWSPTGNGMMSSSGLGAYVQLSEDVSPRKNWNVLAALTADWDTEKIMAEAAKHVRQLANPRVI